MNFDQLAEAWRGDAAAAPARSPAQEVAAVRAKAAELARDVRRRDRLETGVALAMVPFFAWTAVRAPHPLTALGAAIITVALVLIPVRLRMARHRAPEAALPVAWALRAELARVRAQERLLGTVAWWYLGPLGVGYILVKAGGPGSPLSKAAYAAGVVALAGGLLYLNLRAVRRELRPLADELERWLDDLDEPSLDGSSFDEPSSHGAPDAS
jgi:hypothetical protein